MFRKFYPPFLGIFLILSLSAPAQNVDMVRRTVDSLCSKYMAGRGYTHNGDLRAANYLADQYFRIGLQKFGSGYFQNYHFSINTFPGNVLLQVNDTVLQPGKDFLVSASCEGLAGQFELVWMADTGLTVKDLREKIKDMDLRKKFLVLERAPELMRDAVLKNVKGVLLLRDGKLTWSVSKASSTRKMMAIEILRDKLPVGQNRSG